MLRTSAEYVKSSAFTTIDSPGAAGNWLSPSISPSEAGHTMFSIVIVS